jgi:hypothetical protein
MQVLAALLFAATASMQDAAPATPVDPARELWARFLTASGSRPETAPICAFTLRADVVTREGVQTNQLRTEYRFLAPDFIRFLLASQRETGRAGPKQRDYWLRDKDEVVPLVGADHEQDRWQVDRMLAVARNFVGLSDPAKVRIAGLELLAAPPADLGPDRDRLRRAKKLRWLRVASPDFVLTPETAEHARASGSLVQVDLGLGDSDLPLLAVVRPPADERAGAARPMLLELDKHVERGGYRVPLSIRVYDLDPTSSPAVFAAHAAQDIWLDEIDLRPALAPVDFQPSAGSKTSASRPR